MQYLTDRKYIRHGHSMQEIPPNWEPFGVSAAMDADAVCLWIRIKVEDLSPAEVKYLRAEAKAKRKAAKEAAK
ncbi:hypothetical protein LCGC14_1545050 [marine sediment metagenome]|uniref:Uncharacterized protein n=1 Tax=marine sediment metagenome TaxID=412755 RepID=A0A0F9IRU5_9ZZZZ